MPRRLLPAFLVLAIVSPLAAGQDILSSRLGQANAERFGSSVARIHDYDHDGIDDLAVGAPGAAPGGVTGAGEVRIISSADGSLLASLPGSVVFGRLGQSLLRLPDLTADGVPELAVGQPGKSGISPAGEVVFYDLTALVPLGTIPGPVSGARLGEGLVRLDDVTGDQVPDFAASAPGHGLSLGTDIGAVLVIDPVSRQVVRTIGGAASYDGYGRGLGTIPDMTGDLRRELVIGAPGHDPPFKVGAGLVEIVDATSGAVIRSIPGFQIGEAFGYSCDGTLDLDWDLVPDLVAGAPSAQPGGVSLAGTAYLLSGTSGQVLATHQGIAAGDSIGTVVAGMGDLDGDAVDDYAVGSPFALAAGGSGAGLVTVFSGATRALLYRFDGAAPHAGRGGMIRALGDVDLDGRPDFAVGAPNHDGPALDNSGRIDLHLGQTGALEIDSSGHYGTSFTIRVQATPVQHVYLLVDLSPGYFPSPFGPFYLGFTPTLLIGYLGMTCANGWLVGSGLLPLSGPPNLTVHAQCVVTNSYPPPSHWAGGAALLTLVP